MNAVIISGYIASSLNLMQTKEGNGSYCMFDLAVQHFNGATNDTDAYFIPCVCYGIVAVNLSKYCMKGSGIIVNGYIRSSLYLDKNTNTQRKQVTVVATNIEFTSKVGGKENEGN